MTQVLIDVAGWLSNGPGWLPVLLNAVLKATALLAVGWLVSLTLHRASAALRHFVWTTALAGALLMPALLLVVPDWSLPVLPEAAVPGPERQELRAADPPFGSRGSGQLAERPQAVRPGPGSSAAVPGPLADAPNPSDTLVQAWALLMPGASVWLTVWGAVALALVGRLAQGHVRVRRLARRTSDSPPWLSLGQTLAAGMGLARAPTFVEGTADAMPMTWGLWSPVVMVPASARVWPEPRLRVVLLHELSHVKRRDCLTQTIAGLVCAIYWFNPLSWVAAGRLRAERERACDDSVLLAGTDGGDYAEQLLDIARAMRPAGLLSWATVSMARRSQLEGRLLAILDPDLSRRTPTRLASAIAVLTLALVVPALAAVEAGSPAGTVMKPASPAWVTAAAADGFTVTPGQRPTPTPTPTPMPTPVPAPNPRPNLSGTWNPRGNAPRNTWLAGKDDERQAPVDQKVIDALVAALKDTDADVREQALATLGHLRDPRVAPVLAEALTDKDANVREQAAAALGQSRNPAVVDPLIAALKDAAPAVRERAAFALGQLRDLRAVEPLIATLGDASADVREQSAFALSQLRDRRATPKLAAALGDSDADVREQAAFALSQLRDPASVDALTALLKDPKPDVRERAAFALGQIRDARALNPLLLALKDAAPGVQEQAAFALGRLRSPHAVDALIAALSSSSADVREQAAGALGQIGDAKATDALTAALKDANADVRQAAARALAQVIGRENQPAQSAGT